MKHLVKWIEGIVSMTSTLESEQSMKQHKPHQQNPYEDRPEPTPEEEEEDKNEPTITLIWCTKCKSFVGRGHTC